MSCIHSSTARKLPGASCSYPAAAPARAAVRSRRTAVRVEANTQGMPNHDPENLFRGRAVETGIINRRMQQKMSQMDKADMQRAKDDIRKAVVTRREARAPPNDHYQLVEFLLNTEAEDMEYEVARCRPRLSADFFRELNGALGRERFALKPDQDRIAELETLRQYLEEAVEAVDKAVTKTASAADRLKKLLTSPDKKQTILDMAAANEIDKGLVDLLTQNIEAAKAAEQEQAAEFMEKVRVAVAKYLVTV